jgi:hypothetical protein
VRSIWWSRRAIGLHVAVVVSVPGFFVLGWWQLHRALSGNDLSWVYTFEWPFFAAYAVWMWWKLVHDDSAVRATAVDGGGDDMPASVVAPAESGMRDGPGSAGAASDGRQGPPFDPYDESDPELAAYNRYLAGLHASDRAEHP